MSIEAGPQGGYRLRAWPPVCEERGLICRGGRDGSWRCTLIGFAQGTGAHVRDLVRGGIHAYSSVPQAWIQVFFVSLVVLDPLVVVLIAFVRREGIWLAAGVMVLDVAANWTGNWPSLDEDPARLLRPVGLLPITLFGVFVLVTTLPLLRVMKD
jgi:hypothetical protein